MITTNRASADEPERFFATVNSWQRELGKQDWFCDEYEYENDIIALLVANTPHVNATYAWE